MKNGFTDDLPIRVQNALDFIVADGVVPGCALMVGRGGELVNASFSGYEDVAKTRPITKDTVYRMYSMTKLITAVSALQLWERGAFSMSDLLSRYIPEFEHMTVLQPDGSLKNAETPIRIKNLFNMTAGFSYDDVYGTTYYKDFSNEWAAAKAAGDDWDTVTVVRKFAKLPLRFEPGSGYAYSFAFDVLGALVEVWSGETLAEYAKNHIFKPLGMNNSGFSLADVDASHLADMITDRGAGIVPTTGIATPIIDVGLTFDDTRFYSGGAGLLSTIGDYFKFARMLALGGTADGVKILSSRTVKYMHTDQLNDVQKRDLSVWGGGNDTCSFTDINTYGLGTRILIKPHREMYASLGEWGWSGALGTWVSIDPEEDMFYVYAHQRTPSDNDKYLPRVTAAIYSSME